MPHRRNHKVNTTATAHMHLGGTRPTPPLPRPFPVLEHVFPALVMDFGLVEEPGLTPEGEGGRLSTQWFAAPATLGRNLRRALLLQVILELDQALHLCVANHRATLRRTTAGIAGMVGTSSD